MTSLFCFPQNLLTDQEKKEGWELLFDGKTTKGRHTYNMDKTSAKWKAKNGYLITEPKLKNCFSMQDLVTDKEFENFELFLEWEISRGGNSGVLINVRESPKVKHSWRTGPEKQILDNENALDRKN